MSNLVRFPSPASESDAPAREAALDIRQSCIVEAPAGSGKTGLLMQRFLKLLAESDLERPEEVLAITFTNKATAELRDRVLAQLSAAAHNTPLPTDASPFDQATRDLASSVMARDAALYWGLLDRPHGLNIRTIDAVCAEIAGSLPLLSGSGGTRQPTTDAAPLYRLAAERTLFRLGGLDAALHAALRTVLLHRDASLSDVQALLADMLDQRDQWADFLPLGPNALDDETLDREVRARLERTLEFIVCSTLTRAANAMPAGMLHELTQLAAQLGLNPGYKGEGSPIAFCAHLRLPPEERADHLDHWHALIALLLTKDGDWRKSFSSNHIKFEMSKTEKAALQNLIDAHKSEALCAALCAVRDLPDARYPEPQWIVIKALFRVLRHALAELKVIFAERSECDFTEIALAARQALQAPDAARPEDDSAIDLALSSGGKLRHLLVDEMQDTSATQYELIHQLTRSWDGASQTLFLVGDPKQSIYLFRQARVERFLRTMHEARFGEIRLQALRLTSNFRSQAGLVHAFNSSFERIFPSPQTAASTASSDVPFVAATPVRAASPTANIAWHAVLLDPQTISRREHEAAQAHEIRRSIERWIATPLPPGRSKPWRIAVLARARRHLDAIVAEFKRDTGNGPLPFRAVDIDSLAERPEILDALALTRALLHPADRTAWLAVLHAPWCGLSLADLLALTGEGSDPTASGADPTATVASLVASRADLLTAEGQAFLARAWPVLETAVATLGHAPFPTQVERTWRSLGGDAPLTPGQRSNVLRFLAVLRDVQADIGYADLRTLTARLQRLFAEPASSASSVELLTIHKAKGLEWDVVYVPSLERRSGANLGDLLNWLEVDTSAADSSSVVLAPIASKGSDTDKLNRWLNSARETRENAERKRLFYVLSTRAREELHLFGAVKLKNDGTLAAPDHGSLLKAVWPAAAQAFEAAQHVTGSTLIQSFEQDSETYQYEVVALAASVDATPISDRPPILHRLPLTFNPRTRFEDAATARLPYAPAIDLHSAPAFSRPEGSYTVRAFGNVVHRFLQLLSTRLQANPDIAVMLAELPSWSPRLAASLRAEGLSPAGLDRLTQRAVDALNNSLTDPAGCWILSPQPSAQSEQALRLAAQSPTQTAVQSSNEVRVDRTFLAGPDPLSTGSSHLWIVDFKTTQQGTRSDAAFATEEQAKYSDQLEIYARAQAALPGATASIMLGLYYPLAPRLIFWNSIT